ncbi:hypothetical protein [Vibrio phage V-YDF132]|nr:hypothetical protein [Vibrio phage V-YDF132]
MGVAVNCNEVLEMSRKSEQQMAALLTDKHECIKQMSPSWKLHYANNPMAPLSEYVATLLAQIARQDTQIKELTGTQND